MFAWIYVWRVCNFSGQHLITKKCFFLWDVKRLLKKWFFSPGSKKVAKKVIFLRDLRRLLKNYFFLRDKKKVAKKWFFLWDLKRLLKSDFFLSDINRLLKSEIFSEKVAKKVIFSPRSKKVARWPLKELAPVRRQFSGWLLPEKVMWKWINAFQGFKDSKDSKDWCFPMIQGSQQLQLQVPIFGLGGLGPSHHYQYW